MVGRVGSIVLAALLAAVMFAAPAGAHKYGKSWDGNPNGEGRFGVNVHSNGTVTAWADDVQRDGHCVAVVAVSASYYEEKWSCGDKRSKTWNSSWNIERCVTGHHLNSNDCAGLWN